MKTKWRELLTDSHTISWADGSCTAVCAKWSSGTGYKPPDDWVHEAPDKNCNCGIYALDDLADLYEQYRYHTMCVVAVVSASGRTFEHRSGIKTQHARVVAYWVLDHVSECMCRLCANQRIQMKSILPRTLIPQSVEYEGFLRTAPLLPNEEQDGVFSYVRCCETQFSDAKRFSEPDEMAVEYGLKASPVSEETPLKVTSRGVDFAPLINRTQGNRGHYVFEIPYPASIPYPTPDKLTTTDQIKGVIDEPFGRNSTDRPDCSSAG